MRAFTTIIVLAVLACCWIGCERSELLIVERSPLQDDTLMSRTDLSTDELEALYFAAVEDARNADSDEIAADLIAITTDNPLLTWQEDGDEQRVLVVTWTSYPDSYHFGETITNDWGELWVTVSPELRNRLTAQGDTRPLRVLELLGLPPGAEQAYFATLWVRPADLFRPAPDNEVTDSTAGLEFPSDVEDWYIAWYNQNLVNSFLPLSYPWTQLGYTYDWAPGADEQGVSEFVVKAGSTLIVDSLVTTAEYLSQVN